MSDAVPLDLITPAVGALAKLTVNFPQYDNELANTIYVQVKPGNVGDVYFGRETMDVALKTGIIAILRPPTASQLSEFKYCLTEGANPLRLGVYRIGVDK